MEIGRNLEGFERKYIIYEDMVNMTHKNEYTNSPGIVK